MNEHVPARVVRPVPNFLPGEAGTISQSGVLQANNDSSLTEVQLREYLRLIYKYRYVALAIVGVCILLSAIYAFTATPMFVATSKVKISTYEPVLTATKIEDMLQQKSKETTYLETQLEEMRSRSLGDRVLRDNAIAESFKSKSKQGFLSKLFSASNRTRENENDDEKYSHSTSLIDSYLNTIMIRPVRKTSLVLIDAISADRKMAALIANKHAETYIEWVRTSRVEQQSRGLQYLRQQADELREKVADLEREVADYAEANSIVAVNKDENITVQKMSQLNQMLTTAVAKRIEAENVYHETEKSVADGSAGVDDVSLQNARSELAKLESEYGQLSAKFTSSYPKMQQLKAQIDELKATISGQRKQIILGLKAKADAALMEESNLREELEQQKSRAFELSKKEVQYNVLNRDLNSNRELLQNVLKQIKETSLAVENNASTVSIVDYAVVPSHASYPRKLVVLCFGLLSGICLGFAAALLLSYMDNTVRTPDDLVRAIGIANLGVVPSFALEKEANEAQNIENMENGELNSLVEQTSPVMFVQYPKSLASEAYRTIRTGLLLSQAGEPPRTILVTSAQLAEGKTTSSVNLAASLASTGGRVILIDADLRRPSVHKQFGLPSDRLGLVEVLAGQLTLEQVWTEGLVPGLTVITSGRIPPNPAELLGSREMAAVLDHLASTFDYVVIDSPPVLPVTDSVILSRFVDGVVFVIRGASTPRRVVSDAKARLKAVGARFLGAILNDVDVTGGDYYYYNRYYHAYYGEIEGQNGRGSGASRKKAENIA